MNKYSAGPYFNFVRESHEQKNYGTAAFYECFLYAY